MLKTKLVLPFILLCSAFCMPSFASANTSVSGTISSNTTWTLASSTFIVTGDVTVNAGVTLTIQPGVVVKFNGLFSIINNGTLSAIGNATNTIYFTSYKDDTVAGDTNGDGSATSPAAGNWSAVKTGSNATTTIKYAELRYATNGYYNSGGTMTLATTTASTSSSYGIWSELGTTTVTYATTSKNTTYGVFVGNTGGTGVGSFSMSTSTLKNNGGAADTFGLFYRGKADLNMNGNNFATNTTAAMKVDYIDGGPGTFTHSGNTAWGNGTNGILIASVSSFGGNRTWTSDSIPYVLPDSASTVSAGKTLTISSGAVIKFTGVSGALNVSGTLTVQGSTSSPVYFTSLKDDVLNDTNANGTASVPYGGDWQMVQAASGGTVSLDHAIIRYGGSTGVGEMVLVDAGTMTVSNSEVASSSRNGFTVNNNGVLTITYSDIHNCGATTSTSYFGVQHLKGTTTIATSTIRNNSNYGVLSDVGSPGGNIYLYNNTFTNSGGGAVFVYLGLTLNLVHANNTATGTGKGGIVIYGTLGGDQTWYADPLLPYIISSATGTIISTKNITIAAGAVLKFDGAAANFFENSGTLTADSSASTSKIYFTSIKDDTVGGDTNGNGAANSPAAGDWDTLKIGGTATLKNAVIRYGGNTVTGSSKMLWNNGGIINLNNVEIATSSLYGLYDTNTFSTLNATSTTIHHNAFGYAYAGGVAHIANNGNTIYSNSTYGISNSSATILNAEQIYWPATTTGATMNGPYSTTTNPSGHGDAVLPTFIDFDPWVSTVSGNISTNTTWTASSTYVVDGTLTVNAGVKLRIATATIMKFKDSGSSLIVNGELIADSNSSSSKIYFTSYKDDTVGGDTNLDGSATSPGVSNWGGIKVNTGASTTMANVVVSYAGSGSSISLWNNGGYLAVFNSEIATGSVYGIYNTSGHTNILASNIHGNNYGLYCEGGTLYPQSNSIHGNSSYGVYNASCSGNINAKNNYWGASSGPYDPFFNPLGGGDSVSTSVDYRPYLDQAHYLSFWDGQLQTSVQSKILKWAWYNATSTYASAWYAGVSTWNTYGSSVGGVSIATSTTGSTTAYLVVQDIATSSSDYFLAAYDHNPTPQLIKFNPYYMNTATTSVKILSATHELGHSLGLGHSYLNNIMLSYATSTGQTALGVQDKLDYDYLNANLW